MKKFYFLTIIFALVSMTVFAQQKPITKPKTQPVTKPKTTTNQAKPDTTKKTTTGTQNKTTTTEKKTTTTPTKTSTSDVKKKTTDSKTKSSSNKSKSSSSKSKKSSSAKSKEKDAQTQAALKESSKKRKAALPYYQIQNFITLNGGFFYFKMPRSTSLPVYFNPELTLSRNLTIGVQAMHYQYKDYIQFKDEESADFGYTEYPAYTTKYNHLLTAVKLSYHLNDIVKDNLAIIVNPEKMDLYVSGLAGYNFVFTEAPPKHSELRLGFALGGRILYSKRLAFFMEYGINDYGYGSLGMSWLLGERF